MSSSLALSRTLDRRDHGAPTAGVAFADVSKTFDDGTRALQPTSFSIEPGEFVSLIGPSGSGKSTVLRLAAGLDEPTTGSVGIDRDRIGYVFQDPTLLPWRSVQRNVELLMEIDGVDKRTPRQSPIVMVTPGPSGRTDPLSWTSSPSPSTICMNSTYPMCSVVNSPSVTRQRPTSESPTLPVAIVDVLGAPRSTRSGAIGSYGGHGVPAKTL
ncbi:MAG: ATP-binding cassette domain-containing protein [Microbacterium sp.]|uniref:ATP-binding cassette domain-containing protein n=1 Tax=Microbacterium sp. TaxID=51671 RepID=UPI003F7F37F3